MLSETIKHIEGYLEKNLPAYTLLEVQRKSAYPEDAYLYMAAAEKNDGTYAVWTCWNESTGSLNYGHYGLKSFDACREVMQEKYTSMH